MGFFGTAAVLAKAVECDVLDSGTSRVWSRCRTRALTFLRSEGTAFALQTARPSHAPDNHLEIAVLSPVGNVKAVSSLSTFVQNTFTLSLRFPFERPPHRLKKYQIKVCVTWFRELSRLQNNPYFCVFKYAQAVKQKVWNEAENREGD